LEWNDQWTVAGYYKHIDTQLTLTMSAYLVRQYVAENGKAVNKRTMITTKYVKPV